MASGIHYAEFPFLNGDDTRTYYDPDLRRLALEHTRIARGPGESFHYNNFHPLLLGMVLERATGVPVAQYLQDRLWQPAGMVGDASWSLDSEASGFEKMESGFNARAEDFARFGLLMLRQGRAGHRSVVPAGWIAGSTAPPAAPLPADYYAASGLQSRPELYYHAMWWGTRRPGGGHDFSARGNHGQLVHVSPANDVVVVRHGWRYGLSAAEWSARAGRLADALARSAPAKP
jgi:CubicO group peptidase (beta-lactamase class C family)